jgi:CAAX prenyl protease-like protein
VTNSDADAVPIGTYSTTAFWVVALGFALSHPEWLVALVAGILFALLLRSTRSMFAVILSHAVANLALGVYIVATGDWKYW